MSATLSPSQWSAELDVEIKALEQERKFVAAVAATGIVSGLKQCGNEFVLTSSSGLAHTKTIFKPLAIKVNAECLFQPFRLLRNYLVPVDGKKLEEPGRNCLNLLVHATSDGCKAEYVSRFMGVPCVVMVNVTEDELPAPDDYKEYRGMFFKNKATRLPVRTCANIDLEAWAAAAESFGFTGAELTQWNTFGLATAQAGGVPEVATLKKALPSLAENRLEVLRAIKLFTDIHAESFDAKGLKLSEWRTSTMRKLEQACFKLKARALSKGVSQPWHPSTVARLLENALPAGVNVFVEPVSDAQTNTSHSVLATFEVRPLGPWSSPVALKLPQQLNPTGIPGLSDSQSFSIGLSMPD